MDPGFIGYPLNVFEHWSVFPRIDTGPIIFKMVIFTKFSWVNLGKKNELTSSHLGLILACFSYLIRELLCFYRFSLVHVNSLFPTRPFCLLLIKSWIFQCYPILCMWSQSFLNGTVWFNHQCTIFQLTDSSDSKKILLFCSVNPSFSWFKCFEQFVPANCHFKIFRKHLTCTHHSNIWDNILFPTVMLL